MTESMQNALILAVDDDTSLLQFIKTELSLHSMKVIPAINGDEALGVLKEQSPDVILMDIMMPDMDGLELMRRIRETSNVPILLLTARRKDQDKIRGLDLGADDYLSKPFNPEELSARIRALLRRGRQTPDFDLLRCGDVEIDLTKRVVKKGGEPVALTRTEWLLLQFLAANTGRVILNAELLTRVWGVEYCNDLQYLRVWISRLRNKLGSHSIIQTLPGIGYKLEAEQVTAPDAEVVSATA